MVYKDPDDEAKFEEIMIGMFDYFYDLHGDFYELEGNRTKTFHDAGLLTSDKGIVIRLYSGKEYHLIIKRYN